MVHALVTAATNFQTCDFYLSTALEHVCDGCGSRTTVSRFYGNTKLMEVDILHSLHEHVSEMKKKREY